METNIILHANIVCMDDGDRSIVVAYDPEDEAASNLLDAIADEYDMEIWPIKHLFLSDLGEFINVELDYADFAVMFDDDDQDIITPEEFEEMAEAAVADLIRAGADYDGDLDMCEDCDEMLTCKLSEVQEILDFINEHSVCKYMVAVEHPDDCDCPDCIANRLKETDVDITRSLPKHPSIAKDGMLFGDAVSVKLQNYAKTVPQKLDGTHKESVSNLISNILKDGKPYKTFE